MEAVGSAVSDLAPGDRVGWVMQMGSYAEAAVRPAAKLVRLPEGVTTTQAAAALLQGMTAHYLVRSTPSRVQSGMPVLVHAAAGGMGLLLCQMCRALGARVFGTVSTEAKAQAARAAGADHVIRYTEEDFAEAIREELGDKKLAVAYDSVGETTWRKSLGLLRPRGMLVLYGQSSGPVPPIDPLLLSQNGSLFVTRPTLGDYAATHGRAPAGVPGKSSTASQAANSNSPSTASYPWPRPPRPTVSSRAAPPRANSSCGLRRGPRERRSSDRHSPPKAGGVAPSHRRRSAGTAWNADLRSARGPQGRRARIAAPSHGGGSKRCPPPAADYAPEQTCSMA